MRVCSHVDSEEVKPIPTPEAFEADDLVVRTRPTTCEIVCFLRTPAGAGGLKRTLGVRKGNDEL